MINRNKLMIFSVFFIMLLFSLFLGRNWFNSTNHSDNKESSIKEEKALADVGSTPKLITPHYSKNHHVVADFVLKASGSDMTSVIQSALNSCGSSGGGTVWLERGIYSVSSSITIPTSCTLIGDWQDPDSGGTLEYGTKIVVDVNNFRIDNSNIEATGLFKLSPSSGVEGITIYYKNQSATNPVAQPWTFYYGTGMLFNINDVTIINGYLGIGRNIHTDPHEMLMIKNVKGTILKKGVTIHNSSDVGTVNGLYLKTSYWANANLKAFNDNSSNPSGSTIANTSKSISGVGMYITDAEQQQYANITLEGFKHGIYFPDANEVKSRLFGSGTFYNLNISNCDNGIYAEGGIYKECSFKNCTMIDYRWGYLISNSSIEGKDYAIYTLSPTVSGKVGTFKLNDVSIKGKVGGSGAVIYNKSGDSYDNIPKDVDLTGQVNNTGKFSNINIGRNKKSNGNNFTYLSAGSSVGQINNALSNISSQGGGVVYLRPGVYQIDSSVIVPGNVELRGSSATSTRTFNTGTTFNVVNNVRAIRISGNNSGVTGINIIYQSNVNSLNNSPSYTGFDYSISAENSNNIFIRNVSIAAGTLGIYLNNCNGFTIENIVTGILENVIRIDNSSNGTLMEFLQNATVISRNILYGYNEANFWKNIFEPTTYKKLQQVVINDSTNIELLNIFAFGIKKSISAINSQVYAVNIGKDATDGIIIENSNSKGVLVNALNAFSKTLSNIKGNEFGTYNVAKVGGIREKDNLANIFKLQGGSSNQTPASTPASTKTPVETPTPAPTVVPVVTPKPAVQKGDVNSDKKVGAADYIKIKKHILDIKKLSADEKTRADVNNDDKINASDYIILKKAILNEENVTPVIINWDSTSLSNTVVNVTSGTTTICNIESGSSIGKSELEYSSTCTGTKTASISNNCATISILACQNNTLQYRIKTSYGNYSNTIMVNNIGKYMIFGQVYNQLLYVNSPASNNSSNIGNWVSACSNVSDCVKSIGDVALNQRKSDNNKTVIEYIYKGVLGRGADSDGLNAWTNNLNNGMSRNDVLSGIIGSAEAKNIYNKWGYN